MRHGLDLYREVWCVDFEYQCVDGGTPVPVCMVAREYHSGHLVRLWQDELTVRKTAPFPTDEDSLFVAYSAPAELSCFLALDWPFPSRILDLYAEFRNITSGLTVFCGYGLLGCLKFYGLDGLDATEKAEMRALAMRGGPYSESERAALLDYCQTDVDPLMTLLPRMMPSIDLEPALFRGRYTAAVAHMERNGIPIDIEARETLLTNWEKIKGRLIERVDAAYGVFDGSTFSTQKFASWLAAEDIPWPRLPSGKLDLKSETFQNQAKAYPVLYDLYQLRDAVSQLRAADLTVGPDGRNRTSLMPWGSKTGRNQPSTTRFVFGLSKWQRSLIKPPLGSAIAYVDWSQQEFGIAAALSGDRAMMAAYHSGDPYLEFAKQAGMAPADATKATHKVERTLCKACILGVQYGMGQGSLANRIDQPVAVARDLLRRHRETYPEFWAWSDAVEQHAMLHGKLSTVWGWLTHVGRSGNPRSLRNFPMQANGAEMMRLATSTATERGIKVCAPIHDAILIEAPVSDIDRAVSECQDIMIEASRAVLDGFELRSDANIVRYPDRYEDEDGADFWRQVWDLMSSG